MKVWHLSQLISLHCVCIPPAEHRLTSSVGWPAFFHLSSSVCGGGIVLICLPHQLFLPHSPFTLSFFLEWCSGISAVVQCLVCLFSLSISFPPWLRKLFDTTRNGAEKFVFNVSPPTPRNSSGDFHSLLRGRRVLYFWKVVCFWGRPLINVTTWRYYIGFSFQRYQNQKESPTFALCEKMKFRDFPQIS